MRAGVALLCFFLSGVAGLAYEVCWIRESQLVFGSTTAAVSTVLAVFFSGLALGSWFFGSRKTRSPLKTYAILEIAVGVYAMLSPAMFDGAFGAYGRIYRAAVDGAGALLPARAALVAVVLLPPTFLLGGTLPLFARQFVNRSARIVRSVGFLYGLNTAGAALGAAAAGFVMIPTLGVEATLRVAGGLSIAAGATVAALRMTAAPFAPARTEERGPSLRERRLVPVLFFVIGAVALANQVLWTRYLTLLVRTTVITYTITLTVVLAGITAGSALAATVFGRTPRRALVLGALQVASGLLFLLVALLPPAAWARLGSGPLAYFLLLLPASVLSGASFPLAIRMVVSEPTRSGAGVGRMTAINTLGGIVGSLLAGFVLIPFLGLRASVGLVSAVGVAAGVTAWVGLERRLGRAARLALGVAAAALWIAIPVALPTRVPQDFLARSGTVVDVREGLNANVAVIQGEEALRLEIDGWWQGENRRNHQIMAAHVPMICHRDPNTVLVVGLGTGQTASRFLLYDCERLDCVDLEPAVFDVVREHFDSAWMSDERVRLFREDGRSFLSHTASTYDVISLELGQIFRPGIATFYTVDFYRSARQRLRPGGILCQFVPMPFLTEGEFRSVLASFAEVFPQSVLWYNTSELLLLGSERDPITVSPSRLELLSSNRRIHEDLRYSQWGGESTWLHGPGAFLGGFLCGSTGVRALAAGAPVYRDDRPVLEYATVSVEETEGREIPAVLALREHLEPVRTVVGGEVPAEWLAAARDVRLANVGDLLASVPLRQVADLKRRGEFVEIERVLAAAIGNNPGNVQAQRLMGDVLQQLGRSGEAIEFYSTAIHIDETNALARRGLAFALHLTGRAAEAIPQYEGALASRPEDVEVLNGLGGALAQCGRFEEATALLRRVIRRYPDFAPARQNLELVTRAAQRPAEPE